MHLKSTKPIKVTTRQGLILVKPHQTINVSDPIGKKLLSQHPDSLKRVKG